MSLLLLLRPVAVDGAPGVTPPTTAPPFRSSLGVGRDDPLTFQRFVYVRPAPVSGRGSGTLQPLTGSGRGKVEESEDWLLGLDVLGSFSITD